MRPVCVSSFTTPIGPKGPPTRGVMILAFVGGPLGPTHSDAFPTHSENRRLPSENSDTCARHFRIPLRIRAPHSGAMPYGHHRLRKGRSSQPGGLYLITFCTDARRSLFRDTGIANDAVTALLDRRHWTHAALLTWVLMPDHWHGLIRLECEIDLARIVGRLKGASAYAIGRRHPQARPIWQNAFHDHALRAEEDLLATAAYIVHNPVRAGLVATPADYPYWGSEWRDEFVSRL